MDDEDMGSMLSSPDIDKVGPWTIKAIAGRAKAYAMMAARAENVAIGLWVERRIMADAEKARTAPAPQPALDGVIEDLHRLAEAAERISAGTMPEDLRKALLGVARLRARGMRRALREVLRPEPPPEPPPEPKALPAPQKPRRRLAAPKPHG